MSVHQDKQDTPLNFGAGSVIYQKLCLNNFADPVNKSMTSDFIQSLNQEVAET